MVLLWIVHLSGSSLEVKRWLCCGVCGWWFQPLTVVPLKRVSAWFFKDSEDSHSGQAVEDIIERVQLINHELQIRAQENGDNQIDYLRPNCFEVSCIVIVYKRNQAPGTVSSRSGSNEQHRRYSLWTCKTAADLDGSRALCSDPVVVSAQGKTGPHSNGPAA